MTISQIPGTDAAPRAHAIELLAVKPTEENSR